MIWYTGYFPKHAGKWLSGLASYTVRKMNLTLRHIDLIPKMQTDIARKFKLKELCLEARKFKLHGT
jgi:hypothetical protein